MIKALKAFVLILTGFFLHKAVLEYSNLRAIHAYNSCIKINPPKPRKYDECNEVLWPTKAESVLLWHPNFWCNYSPFGCGR